MNTLQLLKKLELKPTFKVQDIERICRCSKAYAKLILHRLDERGLIKKVTKNIYTTKSDIWVIASNIAYPSYISFWSASYFFGYTEQIVNTIQLATAFRKKQIDFENYLIKFVPIKHFFGYRKMRTENGPIFIAEPEKLLIDVLLKPKECGNFDEILKIYKNAKFSLKKLINYLKKINKQHLIKRAGYLLELTRGIDISSKFNLDRNYVLLNPFSLSWKKINSKWRIRL